MSTAPVPMDSMPASKLGNGRMEFKDDGTFTGTLSMPGLPQETSIDGTYQVDGDVLTMNNNLNKSTTKSKLRFESDYMALEPITEEPLAYVMYYKRVK